MPMIAARLGISKAAVYEINQQSGIRSFTGKRQWSTRKGQTDTRLLKGVIR